MACASSVGIDAKMRPLFSELGDRLEKSLGQRFDEIVELLGSIGTMSEVPTLLKSISSMVSNVASTGGSVLALSSFRQVSNCNTERLHQAQEVYGSEHSSTSTTLQRTVAFDFATGNDTAQSRHSVYSADSFQAADDECAQYVLRPEWKAMEGRPATEINDRLERMCSMAPPAAGSVTSHSNSTVKVRHQLLQMTQAMEIADTAMKHVRERRCIVVPPSSKGRLAWDLFSMALIGYDMVMIPVSLGFDIAETTLLRFMFWLCLLFWTADIPLTFFTGYFRDGHEVFSLPSIAKKYLQSWFLLDVGIVGFDWVGEFMGSNFVGARMARAFKSIRALRIIRSLRLLRLMKLRRIIEDLQDRITSEYFHIGVRVVKLLLTILFVNHWVACMWYGISIGTPSGSPSWTHEMETSPEARSLEYQYFTSLHWSLTQFTPASMEVFPTNVHERVFSVLTLIFALVVFSSFVSSITAAMTNLRQLSTQDDKNMSMLRRYLRERNIPAELCVRVIRYAEYAVANRANALPEADVRLLQLLSHPLKMELARHNYGTVLARHPFFSRYAEADPDAMRDVCFHGVTCILLSEGDMLFTEASSDHRMLFLFKGRLCYALEVVREPNLSSENVPERDNSGTFEPISFSEGSKLPPDRASNAELSFQVGARLSGREPASVRRTSVQGAASAQGAAGWTGLKSIGGIAKALGKEPAAPPSRTSSKSVAPSRLGRRPSINGQMLVNGIDLQTEVEQCMVEEGQWCCEASLWTHWTHMGSMCAATMCEVLAVDANVLMSVTETHNKVASCSAAYAQAFVDTLNAGYHEDQEMSDLRITEASAVESMAARAFTTNGRSGPPGNRTALHRTNTRHTTWHSMSTNKASEVIRPQSVESRAAAEPHGMRSLSHDEERSESEQASQRTQGTVYGSEGDLRQI